MKVIVTGATGNVGRSVVEALAERDEVGEVVGLARSGTGPAGPAWNPSKTSWVNAGVVSSDLEAVFRGADAVIHLAWAVQPSHDREELERINLDGSRRVFDAVAAVGVPKLVFASTVGAYSPAPKDRLITEDWPIGAETSFHAGHKATIEGRLDEFERVVPNTQVVRLRPALTFRGDAATELCRLLVGPFIPNFLLRNRLIPAIPRMSGLCFQAIHTSDLGRAYALAAIRDVSGAFNLATNPPLSADDLAAALDTGTFPLSFPLARRLADLTWRLRLQPTPPDWLDTAMRLPLMSSDRAGRELGWEPRVTAIEALADLFTGLRNGNEEPPSSLGSLAPVMHLGEVRTGFADDARLSPAKAKLIDQLADAHAIERQALTQMERAQRILSDGALCEIFAAHGIETREQERRVRERLEAYGAGPLDQAAPGAGGIGMDVFAASRPETPAKLVAHAFSYEHMEIATYELLRKTAEQAGDGATAAMARQIAEDAQRTAERLEASFDLTVDASLNGGGKEDLAAQLNRCLADVHAIEKQGLQLLEMAPKVVENKDLERFFATHLRASEEHEQLLRERIEVRRARPAKAREAVLQLSGMQVSAFFAAQPHTTEKLVGFVSAFEHLEIAAYELLGRVARRAGDNKVTSVAERILAEERAAVDELAQAAAGS
jgi:nucleoside-diphosphate-sugar epimerase/ferritin-like metal-binding protein YciE